eukprot:5672477-Pleurochrysis_carterae.AAC.1
MPSAAPLRQTYALGSFISVDFLAFRASIGPCRRKVLRARRQYRQAPYFSETSAFGPPRSSVPPLHLTRLRLYI